MTGIGCFSWRNRETARESKNWPEKNRKQHYLWAVPSETETSAPIVVSYAPSCLCGIIYPKQSLPERISLHETGPQPRDACLTPDFLTWIIHAGRLCPSSTGLTPGSSLMSTILVTFQIIRIYRYSYKKLITDIHTSNIDM